MFSREYFLKNRYTCFFLKRINDMLLCAPHSVQILYSCPYLYCFVTDLLTGCINRLRLGYVRWQTPQVSVTSSSTMFYFWSWHYYRSPAFSVPLSVSGQIAPSPSPPCPRVFVLWLLSWPPFIPSSQPAPFWPVSDHLHAVFSPPFGQITYFARWQQRPSRMVLN